MLLGLEMEISNLFASLFFFLIIFCYFLKSCARGFHGPHCEYLFNPDVYGFNVSDELENKALSTVAIILFLVIVGLIWCLILHRKFVFFLLEIWRV